MNELSKSQMKYLKKLGQKEKAIFQIGKLGLTEVFIEQVDTALEKRELVKFNILQNADETIDEVAYKIAEAIDAIVVVTIGRTAVLYREAREEKHRRISQELAEIE